MERREYKTTTGKIGMRTEEEIAMILEFESRGLRVDEIKTEESGAITVTWADGRVSEYHKIRLVSEEA